MKFGLKKSLIFLSVLLLVFAGCGLLVKYLRSRPATDRIMSSINERVGCNLPNLPENDKLMCSCVDKVARLLVSEKTFKEIESGDTTKVRGFFALLGLIVADCNAKIYGANK